MGSAGLPPAGAAGVARAVREGSASAEETVERALDAADGLGTVLGAFLSVDRCGAIAHARAIDARRRSGEPLGPLAGVPIAVKDNILVDGRRCTCGSRILERYVAPYEATVVSRLRAAGAVVVGKTNLDEFAMGSSTEHSAFATARNPWDPSLVPGGSSGGSAIAVATRISPLALGSETGGSVRQPAAFCGVYGLKPTYGRLSRWGLVAFGSSLDQIGVLALSPEDLGLVLAAAAGPDPKDSTSDPAGGIDPAETAVLRGRSLRIGLLRSALSREVEPAIAASCEDAARRLSEAGCRVEDVEIPSSGFCVEAYCVIADAEASSNLARYDGVRFGLRRSGRPGGGGGIRGLYGATRGEGFGPEVKRRIMLGTYVLSAGYHDAYYDRAQRVRTLIRRELAEVLERVDAVLLPTTPTTAFRLGSRTADPVRMYLADVLTTMANLTGSPALSFPAGADGRGLPIGLQLVGRPLGEAVLLEVARRHAECGSGGPAVPPISVYSGHGS